MLVKSACGFSKAKKRGFAECSDVSTAVENNSPRQLSIKKELRE